MHIIAVFLIFLVFLVCSLLVLNSLDHYSYTNHSVFHLISFLKYYHSYISLSIYCCHHFLNLLTIYQIFLYQPHSSSTSYFLTILFYSYSSPNTLHFSFLYVALFFIHFQSIIFFIYILLNSHISYSTFLLFVINLFIVLIFLLVIPLFVQPCFFLMILLYIYNYL